MFAREWNLPQDNHLGMLVYAMVQEEATFHNYRNLRDRVADHGGDPALEKMLQLMAVDEKAHIPSSATASRSTWNYDRAAVVNQMRRVMNEFRMPAIHDLLDDSRQRVAAVRSLQLFDADIYYREIYRPLLLELGVTRAEMRAPPGEKKSLRVA